ncbi:MAG TPA: hypothetical protein VHO69_01365 [Phototrophicaceae bacterium]|nr:hypothetical protein [Phototrophicaceae bacterium]
MRHRHLPPIFILFGLLLTLTSAVYGQTSPFATPQGTGTTQVTSHATNTNSVGRYQKFEVTFQINRTYTPDSFLPYYYYDPADTQGVNGITIDGHFIAPSGRELIVPAFYYQDYTRVRQTNSSLLTTTNNFAWKLRFAPEELGNYTYYITVLNKSGSTRYPASGTLQFQSVASNSKGFIRVSPRDTRFMEFSNGESFIPNAAGRQWFGSTLRSYAYEDTFDAFGRNGINFLRIWDQNDGYALTVEGRFDAYNYPDDFTPTDRGVNISAIPKGTQMNQRGNYEEDKIIEAAERNGVYIVLCAHGDPYWIWDTSVTDKTASWLTAARVRAVQRNFRYRVARWGYSTSVAVWEHWNEIGHVLPQTDVYNFYQTFAQYQQQTDPYRHLRSTSQGSQTWSPNFWSSPAFDVASYHDYMMISRYPAELNYDTAHFVYRFAQCLRLPSTASCNLGLGDGTQWQGGPKPIYWGELDTGGTTWNDSGFVSHSKSVHDMRWAGLFSPLGTSPIEWNFESQSAAFVETKFREAKIASDFFRGLDYAGKGFTYLSTDDVRLTAEAVKVSDAKLRVLAMRASSGAEAYAWVQNKGNANWNQESVPAAISGNFTISGMAAGSYRVEVWDTYTGQITNSTVQANNGQVTIPVSNLAKDIALKIVSTSQTVPTATFTPTKTPITVTATFTPTQTPTPVTPTSQPTQTPIPTQVVPTSLPTQIPTPTPLGVTIVPTQGPTTVPTQLPTMTNAPLTRTPEVPIEEPGLIVNVNPTSGAAGTEVQIQLGLVNVTDLYGLQVVCQVDPAVLKGLALVDGEGFNHTNSFFVDQGYTAADGTWQIAVSRLRPAPALVGNSLAFTLKYQALSANGTAVNCTGMGANSDGYQLPLKIVAGQFNGQATPIGPTQVPTIIPTNTPVEPTKLPETPVIAPTLPPGSLGVIMGQVKYPGRDDFDNIHVVLVLDQTPLVEVVTGPDGRYSFTDVPTGSYQLQLSAQLSLTVQKLVVLDQPTQVVDLGQIILPLGDTDSNGTVDLVDAAFIGVNFGLQGDTVTNADLNADQLIDIQDLVLLGKSFGLTSPVAQ